MENKKLSLILPFRGVAQKLPDSTFGTMSLHVGDENFVVAFCTTRENLGDRPKEFHVLSKAVDAIFTAKGITSAERTQQLANLKVRIDLSASATLDNFAHNLTVPQPESNQAKGLAKYLNITDEEFSRKYGITAEIHKINAELAQEDLATTRKGQLDSELARLDVRDSITPSQVMDWQYPGALNNGFVYGASDVDMGLEARGSEGCPGFGELCHIDYRGITKASVINQLAAMGIESSNVGWHDEQAIDPADPDNDLASNRREQLAGVPIPNTDRTFNGAKIEFAQAA